MKFSEYVVRYRFYNAVDNFDDNREAYCGGGNYRGVDSSMVCLVMRGNKRFGLILVNEEIN